MATEADQVVLQLVAQTAAHDAALKKSAETYEQAMERIKRAAAGAEGADEARTRANVARRLRLGAAVRQEADVVVAQSARSANATRNLGRQVADIGLGLQSPGVSPFLILAQQGPQVVDALADAGGAVGKFATFLSGPLGAAAFAAVTALGLLAQNFFMSGEEAAKAETKIRSFATYTDLAERATESAKAMQELGEAQSNYNKLAGPSSQAKAFFANTVQGKALQREIDLKRFSLAQDRAIIALRDNQLDQIRAHDSAVEDRLGRERDARRSAAKDGRESEREAIAAQKELLASLVALEKSYDPVAAAARAYGDELERINGLLAAGSINAQTAALYRARLNDATDAAAAARSTSGIGGILDRPGGISASVAADDARIAANVGKEFTEKQRVEDLLQAKRERDVQSLATIYENAFTGGASSIWKTFEKEGLRVLALLLARFTVLQLSGSGSFVSNLGSAATSAIGSAFGGAFGGGGFASGGNVSAGMLYKVNEVGTEGFRPAQSGQIIPLGRMRSGGGGGNTYVTQSFTLDARGGISTPELLTYVNRTAQKAAAQAGALSYKSAVEATPGRLAREQSLGTS